MGEPALSLTPRLLLLLLAGVLSMAVGASPAMAEEQDPNNSAGVPDGMVDPVSFKAGSFRVAVLLSDGKTPAAGVRVRLLGAEDRIVEAGLTNEDGVLPLTTEAPGQYRLRVGSAVTPICLRTDARAASLIMLLDGAVRAHVDN
ncbi:hypothetical protein ACFL59_14065, partial [Planctomycetota bacterium]